MIKKPQKIEDINTKPPVAVVLGHVDHGKSSLLEAIRDFKITAKESGGITQHIGAYEIDHHGKKITFIDTPGHEAFSAMRTRGAAVADIALLVVDAAQNVQPQTKEAVAAAKNAGIPLIVVLNKIDLPSADPEKIKRELAKIDVLVESMGGQIPSVEVSAKEKKGIDELLEMILLISDMRGKETDLTSPAQGVVIESKMDNLRGPVATLLVEKGTLKEKDIIAAGSAMAKIKKMEDFQGQTIKEAVPGQPIVVLGFQSLPGAGDNFVFCRTVEEAEEKAKKTGKETGNGKKAPAFAVSDKKVLNFILKGDALGSIEAIEEMLKMLPQDKISLNVLKSEAGDINESDAKLAQTSGALIVGFKVKISPAAAQFMKKDAKKRVRIKTFDVIYELIEDARMSLEKSLEPEIVRQEIGKVKVLITFWAEKNRQIVGGKITEGEMKKGLKLDVFREEEKIGGGKIVNLQRDKKDAVILTKGSECGILFEGGVKIEKGDILAAYAEERRKTEL